MQLVYKIFVYVCCRMHPVKPQHSTQIEYIYYFMNHRSLQFKCSNLKISVSVHLQDKSTETQQSIRRSFFCFFCGSHQNKCLDFPPLLHAVNPHGPGGWVTHKHVHTPTEIHVVLFPTLLSLLTLREFPPDTHALNSQGVECMHVL